MRFKKTKNFVLLCCTQVKRKQEKTAENNQYKKPCILTSYCFWPHICNHCLGLGGGCMYPTLFNNEELISCIAKGRAVHRLYVSICQNVKTISTFGWVKHLCFNKIAYIIHICVTTGPIQAGVGLIPHNWIVQNSFPESLRVERYIISMFWLYSPRYLSESYFGADSISEQTRSARKST